VLRAELMLVARALEALETDVLSLDHVGDAIGTLRITPDEIDELFAWLEAQGRVIGDPVGRGSLELLGEVLGLARQLRAELGRTPRPEEIVARSSLSAAAVQRALWFARILQR
jgi:hypothetical protein